MLSQHTQQADGHGGYSTAPEVGINAMLNEQSKSLDLLQTVKCTLDHIAAGTNIRMNSLNNLTLCVHLCIAARVLGLIVPRLMAACGSQHLTLLTDIPCRPRSPSQLYLRESQGYPQRQSQAPTLSLRDSTDSPSPRDSPRASEASH